MKIAIIGGRDFNDYVELLRQMQNRYRQKDITHIVSGGAKGADSLAEEFAKQFNYEMIIFPAKWDRYGRGAGFIRNKLIIDEANEVVAFWDGASKGTLSSIKLAEKAGKTLHIIRYDTPRR